jgi:hypothetical protein
MVWSQVRGVPTWCTTASTTMGDRIARSGNELLAVAFRQDTRV